jgi:hypothetical protein
MAKDRSDNPVLIPYNKRVPELEAQVQRFLQTTPELPKNVILPERTKMPQFKEEREREAWEREEIRRCLKGHEHMNGKMYFFYNYGHMLAPSKGKIKPEYRVCDNEWFKLLEECEKSNEWGIVCVKRRRVGASWKEAADVLHDAMFKPFYNIGMNSKTERDSVELFKKVKFMYDNLPSFLRASTTAGNTKTMLDFSYKTKDEKGNTIKRGTQSTITVVAPTPTAYEGLMLNKWVCDEAGKVEHLSQLWTYTEPCLMEEHKRVGVPVLFGTSGDIGRDGKGLLEMWKNADVYKLKRFFFAGWMGILCDEYGNDLKEEAIRWIIYERDRRKSLSAKQYNDFVQQFPLTVEEAFSQASSGGVGNIVLINNQRMALIENPAKKKRGRFKLKSDFSVDFIPDPTGKCIIYEEPIKGLKGGYISGQDPSDHDSEDTTQMSDLAMYILKKPIGLDSNPRIVFEYVDRPQKASDYYMQSLAALLYYNECKTLIERNRYRMISFFDENGFKHLLATTPQGVSKLVGGRVNTIGIHMNEHVKAYMTDLIDEYIDEYVEEIGSEELLDEFVRFGSENTDRVMAFGIALILLKEDRQKARKVDKSDQKGSLGFKYVRINGRVVRVKA